MTRVATPILLAFLMFGSACGDDSAAPSSPAPSTEPSTGTESTPDPDPHAGLDLDRGGSPPAPSGGGNLGPEVAGGVAWNAPDAFNRVPPGSRMRAAEYQYQPEGSEASARMTVFYFGPGQGGGIQANVDRWVGQFTQPDGSNPSDAADTQERQVNDLKVTTVTVTGTYAESPMMGGSGQPQENMRLLGAIVEGPQGPVFFKLVGPAAVIAQAEAPFTGLVDSFEAQ